MANDKSWQKNPSDWNKVDDVLEDLVKRIALESKNAHSLVLLGFVAKFVALPIIGNDQVKNSLNIESMERRLKAGNFEHNIDKLKDVCSVFNNHLAYRWTKKLLELFAHRTFFGPTADIVLALRVIFDRSIKHANMISVVLSGVAHFLFGYDIPDSTEIA